MSLTNVVHSEAKKMGVSSKNATRALNMLKKGKVDMSRIAPHIKDMFMKNNPIANSNLSLRDKLKAKISAGKSARMSNCAKKRNYDHTRENMKKTEEAKKQEKVNLAKKKKNQKRRYNRSLKELEKKMGLIDIRIYTKALEKIREKDVDDISKSKSKKIIDLYERQQTLLEEEEEISDLSD